MKPHTSHQNIPLSGRLPQSAAHAANRLRSAAARRRFQNSLSCARGAPYGAWKSGRCWEARRGSRRRPRPTSQARAARPHPARFIFEAAAHGPGRTHEHENACMSGWRIVGIGIGIAIGNAIGFCQLRVPMAMAIAIPILALSTCCLYFEAGFRSLIGL